jgi:hypothetical protein
VRLAEPTALAMIRAGDLVDLLRLDADGGEATVVAGAAPVLRVTGADDPTTGGVLLALTPREARRALARSGQGFAVIVRPDG